jgi:hypothetical protein
MMVTASPAVAAAASGIEQLTWLRGALLPD